MTKQTKKTERNPWEVDFVRCELDKTMKEKLKNWDVKGETTYDAIERLISDGFKLTITGNRDNGSVGAWLTSPKSSDEKRQQCLGARGPSFFGALRAIVFKHSVILDGNWDESVDASGSADVWG